MVRFFSALLLATAALTSGCESWNLWQFSSPSAGTAVVPTSPFNSPTPVASRTSNIGKAPLAATETMLVVDKVGKKLIAANPSMGLKPVFTTIGTAHPEVFHQSTGVIFITEGLVRQCKTEAQLAAVLSLELGRMVSEREVLASPKVHDPAKPAPIVVAMGNAGQFNGLDQLQQAEVANVGADRRRPSKQFVPPNPEVLARSYLEAAGFDKKELDNAAPLIAEAEKNYTIEKQFKGANGPPR